MMNFSNIQTSNRIFTPSTIPTAVMAGIVGTDTGVVYTYKNYDNRLAAVITHNGQAHYENGTIYVKVLHFIETDGGSFKLQENLYAYSSPTLPTIDKDIFGKTVERPKDVMAGSRFAPKVNTWETKKWWVYADVAYYNGIAGKKFLDYQNDLIIKSREAEGYKLLSKAHCAIHPFEIYRNLSCVYNVFPENRFKPLQGEPGYLPPHLESACASEFDRLRALVKDYRFKSHYKVDYNELDPEKDVFNFQNLEGIVDAVPGGVCL